MRCPKCYTETPPGATKCPSCSLTTPKGKHDKAKAKEKEFDRKTRKFFLARLADGIKGEANRTKNIIRIAIIAAAIAVTGFACYIVVFSYWESKQVDPALAMKAVEKLRDLPSNQEGFTVDQLMTEEVNKYKSAGNLKGTQGWHLKRMKGTETKVRVVFSFQDNDGQDHRAEWVVDVNSENFIPQTDLAMSVYSK